MPIIIKCECDSCKKTIPENEIVCATLSKTDYFYCKKCLIDMIKDLIVDVDMEDIHLTKHFNYLNR